MSPVLKPPVHLYLHTPAQAVMGKMRRVSQDAAAAASSRSGGGDVAPQQEPQASSDLKLKKKKEESIGFSFHKGGVTLLSRDENEALGCFYHRSVMESFPTQTLSRVACECLCPVAPLKQLWRSSSVWLVECVHVCPVADAAGASEACRSALCSPSDKPSTPAVTSPWNRGPESADAPPGPTAARCPSQLIRFTSVITVKVSHESSRHRYTTDPT